MSIVGGLDIHRKQITFDYLDTGTGQVRRGQVSPADRVHLRAWLARFTGREDVAFAVEGCTGWRYVAEELAAARIVAHVAEPADTAFARGRNRHAKTAQTAARPRRRVRGARRQLRAAGRERAGRGGRAAGRGGGGGLTALAAPCWGGGEARSSPSRKAPRVAGLVSPVSPPPRKGPPGRLPGRGPPVLR